LPDHSGRMHGSKQNHITYNLSFLDFSIWMGFLA
jgi:hypothetical protein